MILMSSIDRQRLPENRAYLDEGNISMSRLAAVIGNPVHHSLSPVIVNTAFEDLSLPFKMVTLEVPDEKAKEAVELIERLNMVGMSVTMPHKKAIADILSAGNNFALDKTANFLEAVNCVANEEGKLVGYNTDGQGFLLALSREGVVVNESSILIFGAGGAGRAVAYACVEAGAKVSILNRDEEKARTLVENLNTIFATSNAKDTREVKCISYKNLASTNLASDDFGVNKFDLGAFDILVNATSLGMKGINVDQSPVSILESKFQILPKHIVIDLVYNPAETKFLADAKKSGAKIIGGLPMLVGQAAHAVKLWTGKEPNLEKMFQTAVNQPILN